MKAHRLNNVPIVMFLMTHAYFLFYHSLSNMLLRRVGCLTVYASHALKIGLLMIRRRKRPSSSLRRSCGEQPWPLSWGCSPTRLRSWRLSPLLTWVRRVFARGVQQRNELFLFAVSLLHICGLEQDANGRVALLRYLFLRQLPHVLSDG